MQHSLFEVEECGRNNQGTERLGNFDLNELSLSLLYTGLNSALSLLFSPRFLSLNQLVCMCAYQEQGILKDGKGLEGDKSKSVQWHSGNLLYTSGSPAMKLLRESQVYIHTKCFL